MILSTVLGGLLLQQDNGGAAIGVFFALIGLVFTIIFIAAGWLVYAKAGQPGWAVIIPIYNLLVMLRIVGRPWWWILLMLIPFVGFIIGIIVTIDLAKSFGRGIGFAIGLILLGPIFYLILAFGGSQYIGPAAAQQGY